MEVKELESALEGVLFAAGEPVAVERLCLGLEVDRPTLDAVAQRPPQSCKNQSTVCACNPRVKG